MYRTRTVVQIPPGLALGQLTGKAGSNIKHLQTTSCAGMCVDSTSGTVTVTGNTADVKFALKLLQAQFDSWRSSAASAYPHPTDVKYVLKNVQTSNAPLVFLLVTPDVVTQFTDRPERLYRLQNMHKLNHLDPAMEKVVNDPSSALLGSFASLSMKKNIQASPVLQLLIKGIFAAAAAGVTHQPLFSEPPHCHLVYGITIPKVFYISDGVSTVLDGMVVASTQAVRATPKLAELKVTFHVGTQFFYAGRYMQTPDHLTNMTTNKMNDGPEIRSLAGIVTGSTMQGGRLNVPCLRSQEVDLARIKTKETYEGTWKERVMRITFSTIRGESGQEHCEVTGRMPSLNDTMQAALADNSNSTQLMATAREDLQILPDFCDSLAIATAGQEY